MEDAFLEIACRLQAAGLLPEETAARLIAGAADCRHWLANEVRRVRRMRVGKTEAANGLVSLAEDFRRAVDANGENDGIISLA